jgi:hypothetical protein
LTQHVVVTGKQSFETDGLASAGYSHPIAGTGFQLGINLPAAQPRAPQFAGAVVAFRIDSLPAAGEYPVAYFIESAAARPRQWSGLIGGPNGSTIFWDADSGVIMVQRSTADVSLAGSFSIRFRCRHCDAPFSTGDEIAISGRFDTRR